MKSKRTYSRKGQNLDGARSAAAVARDHYPTAEEVYEAKCREVEHTRRQWKRHQMVDALFEAIGDLAMGSSGAANRLVLMSRSIERYAKDRLDTEGHTPYPMPPGERL